MAYVRKTVDEFEVVGDYGQGRELVTTEETRREARERLKEYRANEPGVSFAVRKVRTPIAAAA